MHERKPKMTIVVEIEGNFSTLLLKEKKKKKQPNRYVWKNRNGYIPTEAQDIFQSFGIAFLRMC